MLKRLLQRVFSRNRMQVAGMFLKKNAGRIAYYGCVSIALGAIAIAAEQYHSTQETPEPALVLPAAEISVSTREEETLFEKGSGMLLLKPFSKGTLWNETLMHWESHPATDYVCENNAVYSLSEGMVTAVGACGVYGGFVEIETGEYLLRYASIQPTDTIKTGVKIKAGEEIGFADESMPGEAHLGAHLHLEVWKKGDCMDFESLIDKKTVYNN